MKKRIYYIKMLLSISKIAKLWKRNKQCKHFWVRKGNESRERFGSIYTLFHHVKQDRKCFFFRYFCMTPDRFGYLLGLVGPEIEKKNTRLHRAILPRIRLVITLRYFASGETQHLLQYVIFVFIFFHIHRLCLYVVTRTTRTDCFRIL